MLGFVVSATTGFKDKAFIAPVGVPVSVGHGTGLVVEAKSFADSYYDNGAPKDYVSDLVLTKDGQQVARHETRVNSPLIYDGVWFHQSSFGNGADVTVTEGGTTVYSGLVPLQWQSDDGQQSIGQLTIPSRGITVFVVEAASGQVLADLPAGSAQLEVHKAGVTDPLGAPVVNQGQSAVVDGLTYTYERNRQYTGLTVKQDKGSWVVWLGSALLVLGSFLVFFMPHRRVWVRVRDNADGTSRVMVGAPLKRDPGFEPRLPGARLHHHQARRPRRRHPRRSDRNAQLLPVRVRRGTHHHRPRHDRLLLGDERRPPCDDAGLAAREGPRHGATATTSSTTSTRSSLAETADGQPGHRRVGGHPGPVRHAPDLARPRLPHRVPRPADDGHRPRPVRHPVRVRDVHGVGHARGLPVLRVALPRTHARPVRPADDGARPRLRRHPEQPGRPAGPRAAEQPAAHRPHHRGDLRLRRLRGLLRRGRADPVDPAAVAPPRAQGGRARPARLPRRRHRLPARHDGHRSSAPSGPRSPGAATGAGTPRRRPPS